MSAVITAVVISAVAAGAGAVATYRAGQAQKHAAERSLLAQQESERQGRVKAVGEETRAAQASRRANQRRPDVASLLFAERAQAAGGVGSTILGGGRGGRPLLGTKTSLLG